MNTVEDLVAWQLAVQLRDGVYELTRGRSFSDDHDLRRQMRTAASSPARNIAEGFGRYAPRDFARFLTIATASLMELQNHLRHARTAGYLSASDCDTSFKLSCRTMSAVCGLRRYLLTPEAQQNAANNTQSAKPKTTRNRRDAKRPKAPVNLKNHKNPKNPKI